MVFLFDNYFIKVLTIDSILGAMFYSKETEKLDKASFTEAVLN